MPIRPELRYLYPIDWKQLSAVIRFGRAGGRCERCRRPHRRHVVQLEDGRWQDMDGRWRDERGRRARARRPGEPATAKWILLATAHLDHDPCNSRPGNLKALCQRCHLRHDRAEHGRRRRRTLRSRRALGDLFLGPYPRPLAGAGPALSGR